MSQKLLSKNQDQDFGEPLPEELSLGPIKNRKCQDVLYFFLFVFFWVGLILIGGVALGEGDPQRLASPFDSSGNQCGYGDAEGFPYMFFSRDDLVISQSKYACVKSCPTNDSVSVACLPNESVRTCSQLNLYDSIEVITVCIPTSSSLVDSLKSKIDIGTFEQMMSDVKTTWPISLGVVFISFTLSITFLLLMRAFTGLVTWSMIIIYLGLLISLGSLCLYEAFNFDSSHTPSTFQSQQVLQGIGWSLLVFALLSTFLVICFFNKIRKAIAIMKATSQFTSEVWQAFVIPVIMFFLLTGFFAFWVVVSLHIYSSGEISKDKYSPFGSIQWDEGVKTTLIYYIFGLFWNLEFLLGMNQLIIASCAGIWYFSHRQSTSLSNPVSKSFFRGFIYHIGSVCLGSMIVSVVTLIRLTIEYTYNEMKKNLTSNRAASCCVRCGLCCIKYFEDFVRFISTNSYMMIALTGGSFCQSAKQVYFLFKRNSLQFSITQGIGQVLVCFGKLFICASSSLLGYLMITNIRTFNEKIYSPGAPTLIFVIISFSIGSIFMNIYGIAADTLLMCFCSDKELNKGNALSCPRSIKEFEENHMK